MQTPGQTRVDLKHKAGVLHKGISWMHSQLDQLCHRAVTGSAPEKQNTDDSLSQLGATPEKQLLQELRRHVKQEEPIATTMSTLPACQTTRQMTRAIGKPTGYAVATEGKSMSIHGKRDKTVEWY